MNELCIKSANGTNSESDRQYIQDEIDQLNTEIDRISATTKFNEIYLLNGSIGKGEQPTENTGITVTEDGISIVSSNSINGRQTVRYISSSYGLQSANSYAMVNSASVGDGLSLYDLDDTDGVQIMYVTFDLDDSSTNSTADSSATNKIKQEGTMQISNDASLAELLTNTIVPNAVKSILSTYSPLFNYLSGSTIKMGLTIKDDSTSSEKAHLQVGCGVSLDDNSVSSKNRLYYMLSVNAYQFKDKNNNFTDKCREDLEVTIVHEIMHSFMNETLTNGMIGVTNDYKVDSSVKFPNWFIEGMAQTAAGGYYSGNDFLNNMGIKSNYNENAISSILSTYALSNANDGYSQYGTGYLACMYLGYLVGGAKEDDDGNIIIDEDSIRTGLSQIIYEINQGESLEKEIIKYANVSSLNEFENNFATNAAKFVVALNKAVGSGRGGLIGGLSTTDSILPDKNSDTVSLFGLVDTYQMITNIYPDGYEVFTGGTKSEDSNRAGYTVFNYIAAGGNGGTGGGSGTGGTGGTGGGSGTGGNGGISGSGVSGNLTIRPSNIATSSGRRHYGPLILQVGADGTESNQISIYIDAMNAKSLGVLSVNVTTQELATQSIETVANAIAKVSEQRAQLGSYQNRLEHTVKNLGNVVENTTASESLIRDTDMASEMVKFVNSNIIRQVGQSILAQANQSNTGVLALLG
jgi:flagellin